MFGLWEFAALVALLTIPISGLCLGYVIGTDANARGADGLTWSLFTAALFPIAVPAYLLRRRRLPARTEPIDATERRLGSVGIGILASWAAGAVVSPPDPFTMIFLSLPLVVVFVPVTFVVCYEPGWRALVS